MKMLQEVIIVVSLFYLSLEVGEGGGELPIMDYTESTA